MTIPRAEEIASKAAMPVLAPSAVGAGAGASIPPSPIAAPAAAPIGSWLQASLSRVALAPITLDRVPLGKKRPLKPSPLDDAADSKPYALARPVRENRGRFRVQDNALARVWRQQLGGVQKLFRKINQAAYFISIPFLMILLFGALVQIRSMALFGATFLVLLNIGRLVAGGANLAVVPFRDGLNLDKIKKPIQRVIEPAVTIGLVILAFTFIPWLSCGMSAQGSITERIRSGAAILQKDIKGEVDKLAEKSKTIGLNKLGAQAQESLKNLGNQVREIDVSTLGAQGQDKLKQIGNQVRDIDGTKLGAQAQEKRKGLGSPSTKSAEPAGKDIGDIRSGVEALKKVQEELEKAKALSDSPNPL